MDCKILKGNRKIPADTALRLNKYFGTSAKFWLGLQDNLDLEEVANAMSSLINSNPTIKDNAA
jgi:addiction module HigA family antidote